MVLLQQFQREQGLPVTRQLDIGTREALAKSEALSVPSYERTIELTRPVQSIKVSVFQGGRIKFVNKSANRTFNIFSLGPKNLFEVNLLPPDKEAWVRFEEDGETDIEDANSPTLKIKVKVTKTSRK